MIDRLYGLLLLGVVGGLLLGCESFRRGPSDEWQAREAYHEATGMALPRDMEPVGQAVFYEDQVGMKHCYLRFRVSVQYLDTITERYQPKPWPVVEDRFSPPEKYRNRLWFWDTSRIAGKRYFQQDFIHPGQEVPRYRSTLSFDPASGEIFFVASRLGF